MKEIDKPLLCVIITITISQMALFFLKIINVINWSWVWVFAPLWIPYFTLMLCGTILVIYLLICDVKERIVKGHG